LTEFPGPGNVCEVRTKQSGKVIATGYVRVMFGDHGPYLECNWGQVHHAGLWKENRAGRKGKYYELWRSHPCQVKWYEQLREVRGKPNPPGGRWSVCQNRPEGYADYRVGKWYVSMDEVDVIVRSRFAPESLNGGGRV